MAKEQRRGEEQNRGPGAEKVELEKRLDVNADNSRRQFGDEAGDDSSGAEAEAHQQGTPRGHKAQQAQRHRSARSSGGIDAEDDLER